MTILSVNKTREFGWALCARFVLGADCAHFSFLEVFMRKRARFLAYAALLAALYTALTYLQDFLLPGSSSWAIQFRASEALCVLAFFTPAAIPGLTLGCFLFNLSWAAALPLDFLVGSLATALATGAMYLCRQRKWLLLPGLLMPALFNGLLVGWELSVFVGGSFWLHGPYVALGEAGVLLTLGSILYGVFRARGLDKRFFG